jgi:DeoR/GlpR family transcriptional regulator of sugar metabolism
MARRSARTYVLADADKLGRRPFYAWALLPQGWTLVTDDSVDPAALPPFLAHGAKVIVVDAHGVATSEA